MAETACKLKSKTKLPILSHFVCENMNKLAYLLTGVQSSSELLINYFRWKDNGHFVEWPGRVRSVILVMFNSVCDATARSRVAAGKRQPCSRWQLHSPRYGFARENSFFRNSSVTNSASSAVTKRLINTHKTANTHVNWRPIPKPNSGHKK